MSDQTPGVGRAADADAATDSDGLQIAYADPPYFGSCRMYKHHHPDGLCWDKPATHEAMVQRLVADYPDGWALSLTSNSLRMYLPWCPPDVRVAAWVKRTAVYKKGVNPTYAWEPVIYRGGRRGNKRAQPTMFVLDWVDCLVAQFHDNPGRIVPGAKPRKFCYWLFDLLGLAPGDELTDLYPGSGSVGYSWDGWSNQGRLIG